MSDRVTRILDDADRRGVRLLRGAEIRPEPIEWLWEGWLARGKLHVIAGLPGCGKTTLGMAFAATVTSGGRWPDGSRVEPDNVLIWSGEDDPSDTLMPRLLAMGADTARVYFVGDISTDDGRRPFDPARDMTELYRAARRIGNIGLLIVDPIVNAVSGDSHKNGETRRALQPIVDLAQLLNAAALGISHYTKGTQGRDPVERVTGSIAFGALPRIIMGAAKSETDDGPGRLLVRAKSNIGPDGGGYGYDLRQDELTGHPGIVASTVVWGEPLEGTARALLGIAEDTDEGRSELDDAAEWLRSQLEAASVLTEDLKRSAKAAGFSWRTMERAKSQIGAKAQKQGFSGSWSWTLKRTTEVRQREDRQKPPQDLAAFGERPEGRAVNGFQPREMDQSSLSPPRLEGGGLDVDEEAL